MEEYIAVIKLFAGNFVPIDWMACEGQQLSIVQYQALYSLIGTTYGGDGRTFFNLPDLRNAIPIGVGLSPGLPSKNAGAVGTISTHGTPAIRTLGIRYIICVQGLYPPRQY